MILDINIILHIPSFSHVHNSCLIQIIFLWGDFFFQNQKVRKRFSKTSEEINKSENKFLMKRFTIICNALKQPSGVVLVLLLFPFYMRHIKFFLLF